MALGRFQGKGKMETFWIWDKPVPVQTNDDQSSNVLSSNVLGSNNGRTPQGPVPEVSLSAESELPLRRVES